MTTWSTGFSRAKWTRSPSVPRTGTLADRGRDPGPAIIEHADDPHRAAADTPNELDKALPKLARADNGDIACEVSALLPAADLSLEKGAARDQPDKPVGKPKDDPETRRLLRRLGQEREGQEHQHDDRPGGGHPANAHPEVKVSLPVVKPERMEYLGGDQHPEHQRIQFQLRAMLREQDKAGRVSHDPGDQDGQAVAKSHEMGKIRLRPWNPHLSPRTHFSLRACMAFLTQALRTN